MRRVKYTDVFKPNTYPDLTYVTRVSAHVNYTYEERLEQALETAGVLISIIGPSKSGKTVLCDRVIGMHKIISMSGNDFVNEADFWEAVGKKAGIPMRGDVSTGNMVKSTEEEVTTVTKEEYLGSKDRVVRFFQENEKILILDDFHYAPPMMQYNIACQLKEVIRLGFRAIVISLPHHSDDAIRLNPDLVGRLSLIEIEPWKEEELQEIAVKGFRELGIPIDNAVVQRIAMESIHSPQLMQSICLNCERAVRGAKTITDEVVEESCRFTCVNFPYGSVVKLLKAGPFTRGQKRLKYELSDGLKLDLYSIVLKILADNPPCTELNFENIFRRVDSKVIDNQHKVTAKKIKDTLNNLQKLISEQKALYQVFEWKDDCIYILDPLFLFYIRWVDFWEGK